MRHAWRNLGRCRSFLIAGAIACFVTSCGALSQLTKVVTEGESRSLRTRAAGEPPSSPSLPGLLIVAIDGIDRDLLYSMLREGDLPELAALLGRQGAAFPHAYFAPNVLTTFPSTTGVAWATIFTGVAPAEHGFAGNEFFVREKRQFAAPIPVSVSDAADALSVFTEGYANGFLSAPTVYESMRQRDPHVKIWVSMSQFYAGADQLLMTRRGVLGAALAAFVSGHTEKDLPRKVWADLDEEDVEVVVEHLKKGPLPDVLTLYLFGTDDWAHISPKGPDVARRTYLKEVIDPALGTLRKKLLERDGLENRYVVVVSDHGHTEVTKDDVHALSTKDENDPPAVLKRAGFRVRPFKGDVKDSDPFQSVLAYEGAVAYVYLADRSLCVERTAPCDWTKPPRYQEDVLVLADAFYRNNLDGSLAPGMKGTLDLVLARKPVPVDETDLPYEVYVGDGKTKPIEEYLQAHPHPAYVNFPSRLKDLAVGPHGERAGDVLLVAHNGDREKLEDRYYFAAPYHSWHGSPSKQDSNIPLIVAHPLKTASELEATVGGFLVGGGRAEDVGALLVGLRQGGTDSPKAPKK